MITWGKLREIIFYCLDEVGIDFSDPTTDTVTPEALLMYSHAVEWALDIFAIGHTAVERMHTATVLAGGDIEMPTDMLFVKGLYSVSDKLYLRPFYARPEVGDTGKAWYSWPRTLLHTYGVEGQIDVEYYAYHSRIDADDATEIEVPQWAVPAIVWLTMANILIPSSVSAANLAQYKIKVDSGNPEDNPMLLQVKHFISQYEWLIAQHPVQLREVYIV